MTCDTVAVCICKLEVVAATSNGGQGVVMGAEPL